MRPRWSPTACPSTRQRTATTSSSEQRTPVRSRSYSPTKQPEPQPPSTDDEIPEIGSGKHRGHRLAVERPQVDIAFIGQIPGVAAGGPHRRSEGLGNVVV